jgi:hypothetical protein
MRRVSPRSRALGLSVLGLLATAIGWPGSASAVPAIQLLAAYYGTSTATTPAGSDSLCPLATPSNGICGPTRIGAGSLVTGEPYGEYSIAIPAPTVASLDGASNYNLAITVADTSTTSDRYYYAVYLNGGSLTGNTKLGTTPVPSGSPSNGTFDVTLSVSSSPYYLDITNQYFVANNTTGNTTSSQLEVVINQISVPEPATIVLFGTSLGLMRLLRRRAQV